MVISLIWPPDIRPFLISGILPDIRQVISDMRPDTGYKKGRIIRLDIRPAGFPVHPYIYIVFQI
jgi:hypothetical protein